MGTKGGPKIKNTRTSHLQIRVTEAEKDRIRLQAKQAGQEMSEWILSKLLPPPAESFRKLLSSLARASENGEKLTFELAEINDFLTNLNADELALAIADQAETPSSAFLANYLAAMIEMACAREQIGIPAWLGSVDPLENPYFVAPLQNLRMYLLLNSPIPFRKRNIFIDASLGDRV